MPSAAQRTIKQETGSEQENGYHDREVLPALSSYSCAVTNGKPPESIKTGAQDGSSDNGGYGGENQTKIKGKEIKPVVIFDQ